MFPAFPRRLWACMAATLCALVAHPPVAAQTALSGLSLGDRIACQTAIERVYWQHRAEPGRAPALVFEQAVPAALIRQRAEDTVRKSLALARLWDTAIAPEQLQAELDRMAAGSQSPKVLAELFAALGRDPARAAECLARPLLVDRLIRSHFAGDDRFQAAAREQARAG